MTINFFGYITFIILILLPFIKLEKHLYILIFSSVFTATSAFNLKGSLDLSVIPVQIIGAAFIVRVIFKIIRRGYIIKHNIFLFLFVLWCTLSVILLPIVEHIIPNGTTVRRYFSGEGYDLVEFSMGNITQLMYLLFSYFIYLTLYEYINMQNDPTKIIKNIIKTLVIAGISICFIGIYEMIAKFLGLPFMSIFRNFMGVVEYTNYRVSSVAHEPSMFAYCIVIIASLMFFLNYTSSNSNRIDLIKGRFIWFLFICLIGVFSTSTTFLLGFSTLIIILFIFTLKDKKLKILANPKYSIYAIILSISVIYLLNIDFIKEKTINRAFETLTFNNFTGTDRIEKFTHHLSVFKESPLVGMGFGTARSYDGFTTILVNMGSIGILLFIIFILSNFIKMKTVIKNSDSIHSNLGKALLTATLCWLVMFLISVPEMYFIYIWIIFALIDSLYKTRKLTMNNYKKEI